MQEVVAVTVCERLGHEKSTHDKARAYMGPATRKISDEIEAFWLGDG